MNANQHRQRTRDSRAGYSLVELLVYISVLFIVLGVGYAALYKSMDYSTALRRGADDITGALHAGERWRADVRGATGTPKVETNSGETVLHLPGRRGEIVYRFSTNGVFRRVGGAGWTCLLDNVHRTEVSTDARRSITALRWELELQPRKKKLGSLRPLFTFLAVPAGESSK